MNRKMRAKINNAEARKKRDRRPCPKQDEVFVHGERECDECGEELQQAVLIKLTPIGKDERPPGTTLQ